MVVSLKNPQRPLVRAKPLQQAKLQIEVGPTPRGPVMFLVSFYSPRASRFLQSIASLVVARATA